MGETETTRDQRTTPPSETSEPSYGGTTGQRQPPQAGEERPDDEQESGYLPGTDRPKAPQPGDGSPQAPSGGDAGQYHHPDEVRDPAGERSDGRPTGDGQTDQVKPGVSQQEAPTEAPEEQGGQPSTEHAPGGDL